MSRGHGPILTVAFDVQGEEATRHRIALASLDTHFSTVDAGATADVRVVAGTPGSWPDLAGAALRQGPKAIVIANRAQAAEADVARLVSSAATAGAVVAVATPFAGTRTWRSAFGRLKAEASEAAIIDSVMVWPGGHDGSAAGALLDQLAVISQVVPDISNLTVGRATSRDYVAAGTAGRVAMVLAGTRCQVDAPRLQLDIVGTGSRWCVRFDAMAPAIPAVIERHTGDHIGIQSLRFESGYRAAWRDVYDRLAHGVSLPDYLSTDSRTFALARRLISVTTSLPGFDGVSSTSLERSE